MNKNRIRLTAFGVGLALAFAGLAQGAVAPASAGLTFLSTRVNVRIVLDPAPSPADFTAAFTSGPGAVLVLHLGKPAEPPVLPEIPGDDPLIRSASLRTDPAGRTSLILELGERVPYRLFQENGSAVLELVRIQEGGGEYLVSTEAQAAMDRTAPATAVIGRLDETDLGDRYDVTARIGQTVALNIFALADPLRLVVDFIGADYARPASSQPVGKYGLDRIKVGQFRTGDPYPITRIVFDLQEPVPFALNGGPEGVTMSFAGAGAPAEEPLPPARDIPPSIEAPVNGTPPAQIEPPLPPPAAETVPVKAEIKAAPPAEDESKAAAKTAAVNDEQAKEQDQFKPKTLHDPVERYSGELLSPKFKDADLRDVVLWLGERVGLNVMFDPEVRGTVTCAFDNVPWDQFLDLILKNNKMGRILEGNVLRIAPMGVLATEERSQQELRMALQESGPIITKTYTLSYAAVKDVIEIVKNKKSDRGEIVSDTRTNSLIVSDVKEKIDVIDSIIGNLDTPTPQVSIETRIIEVTSTFVRNLGIQWGTRAMADPFFGNQTSLQFPNKVLVDGALIPQGIVTKGIGGPLGGYAVNLPAPTFTTALGVSFANILDTFRLDMAISAMETEGSGRIVSSQRVTAQNNKEAYIMQGRQIPVQTSANFTVTTQYVNAGLELTATPQITAEGTIIMTLDIQNNAADFANLVNGIPPITTQSARTTVMVPDGGTTVIGGIYRVEDSITRERVPFLHQIPVLGSLFKNMSKNRTNRELLIFITPRIQR